MNMFMVWHNRNRTTVWYTVHSEDLEEFYCELFPVNYDTYPAPPTSFKVKRVEGGWNLEKDCELQKDIAWKIEHRLEWDADLRKY